VQLQLAERGRRALRRQQHAPRRVVRCLARRARRARRPLLPLRRGGERVRGVPRAHAVERHAQRRRVE